MMQIVLMIAALILAGFGVFSFMIAGASIEKSDTGVEQENAAKLMLIVGPLLTIAALCLTFVAGGL